jgi:hypothetical protein
MSNHLNTFSCLFFSIIYRLKQISRLKLVAIFREVVRHQQLGLHLGAKESFCLHRGRIETSRVYELERRRGNEGGKRWADILVGKLVVAGKSSELPASIAPPTASTAPDAPTAPTTSTSQKPTSHSHSSRKNAYIVWDYFNGGHGSPEKC